MTRKGKEKGKGKGRGKGKGKAKGKGPSKRTRKGKLANEEDGKGNEEDGKRNEEDGRRKKQRTKTKNAVGNGAVEFYSGNIGKLDKNRADVTGGLSKRTRKRKLTNEEDGKGKEEHGKKGKAMRESEKRARERKCQL